MRQTKACEQISALRQATRQIARELGYLEAKNSMVDITMPQLHAIIEIDHHGLLTVAELARILRLNQSSTCRTIAEMRKRGWVETKTLPGDQKQKPVRLTKAGRSKLKQINSVCDSLYLDALKSLSNEKQTLVLEAFTDYANALSAARSKLEARKL